LAEDVVTDNGICYTVTDKGRMLLADQAEITGQDDDTGPVGRRVTANDHTTRDDVPSILIPADIVIDVKKK